MIQKITPAIIRKIEVEIDEALAAVGEKHGVSLKTTGGGSYSAKDATLKVRLALLDENGEAHDPDAETFKSMATLYGFKPTDLGRVFTSHGKPFKITGLKPGSRKYPVLAGRVPDGKVFKFSPANVLTNLQ